MSRDTSITSLFIPSVFERSAISLSISARVSKFSISIHVPKGVNMYLALLFFYDLYGLCYVSAEARGWGGNGYNP